MVTIHNANDNHNRKQMANNLNDNDRLRLDALEVKIDAIDANVRRLHNAIIGDEAAGSIGMVQRMATLEAKHRAAEKRVEALEDAKKQVYTYAAAISISISFVMSILSLVIRFINS